MGKYGGAYVINEDLMYRWLGITILLSIYRVDIKKMFSIKYVDFGVREHMSEKVYRRLWGSLQLPGPRGAGNTTYSKYVL